MQILSEKAILPLTVSKIARPASLETDSVLSVIYGHGLLQEWLSPLQYNLVVFLSVCCLVWCTNVGSSLPLAKWCFKLESSSKNKKAAQLRGRMVGLTTHAALRQKGTHCDFKPCKSGMIMSRCWAWIKPCIGVHCDVSLWAVLSVQIRCGCR